MLLCLGLKSCDLRTPFLYLETKADKQRVELQYDLKWISISVSKLSQHSVDPIRTIILPCTNLSRFNGPRLGQT